jgi:hypothetical protein
MMGLNQLVLMDGKADKPSTCYAGALRIRATSLEQIPAGQEASPSVVLQLAVEPKLQLRSIMATHIDKAVDDNGQILEQRTADGNENLPRGVAPVPIARQVPPGIARNPMMGGPGQTVIQFKKGEKSPKALKELKGSVTIQLFDESRMMLTADDILKSSGAKLKNKDGASLTIVKASQTEAGQVAVQVELEIPNDVMPARPPQSAGTANTGGFRINAAVPVATPPAAPAADKPKETPPKAEKEKAKEEVKIKPDAPPGIARATALANPPLRYPGNMFNGIMLVDENGKSFPINRINASTQAGGAGNVKMQYELTFEATKELGAPTKLIFSGSRIVTLDVPFTLKDMPLK